MNECNIARLLLHSWGSPIQTLTTIPSGSYVVIVDELLFFSLVGTIMPKGLGTSRITLNMNLMWYLFPQTYLGLLSVTLFLIFIIHTDSHHAYAHPHVNNIAFKAVVQAHRLPTQCYTPTEVHAYLPNYSLFMKISCPWLPSLSYHGFLFFMYI